MNHPVVAVNMICARLNKKSHYVPHAVIGIIRARRPTPPQPIQRKKHFISHDRSLLVPSYSTTARAFINARFSPHIRRSQRLNHACSVAKPCTEDAIGILKHAVLETDNDELRALEPGLDQTTNVLCVREIQGGIDLVQDVHGSRLELQQRHDQRQCNKGPVIS